MDIRKIKKLIELVEESGISELEVVTLCVRLWWVLFIVRHHRVLNRL
jgi:hypothetical protein